MRKKIDTFARAKANNSARAYSDGLAMTKMKPAG